MLARVVIAVSAAVDFGCILACLWMLWRYRWLLPAFWEHVFKKKR